MQVKVFQGKLFTNLSHSPLKTWTTQRFCLFYLEGLWKWWCFFDNLSRYLLAAQPIPSIKKRKIWEAQLCIVVMQFRNFIVLRNLESISFYSVFCFECRWKSFKVNCLQTYLIVLWKLEQHNVSAYFTSKVYEDGAYLIILKTFTNFWMLEENKVVQRSHFKQTFSPSSMEDLWPRSGFGNFDLLLLLLAVAAAQIPDEISP